jgi:hypothetical protein
VVCEFRGKWKVSGGVEHEVGGTRKKEKGGKKGKTKLQISRYCELCTPPLKMYTSVL